MKRRHPLITPKGITAKDDTPKREPKQIEEKEYKNILSVLLALESLKDQLVKDFELPVEDPAEVNFCVWRKPYRTVLKGKHPTLFLYNEVPKADGNASALHGARQILGFVRPFAGKNIEVVQTIEAEVYTFYILFNDHDVLPDEDAEYKPFEK